MPPKRVDWLKDIPQQRTIVRRTPPPTQQQFGYSGAPFDPAMIPSAGMRPPAGTFTGAGVDGVVQPGKMAGMLHEGESTLTANATQAIPKQTFMELERQASSGTLDVNKLNAALGLPPIAGFQSGVYNAPASSNQGEYDPAVDNVATNPIPKPSGTLSQPASPYGITPALRGPVSNGVSDTIKPSNQGYYDPMVDANPATINPLAKDAKPDPYKPMQANAAPTEMFKPAPTFAPHQFASIKPPAEMPQQTNTPPVELTPQREPMKLDPNMELPKPAVQPTGTIQQQPTGTLATDNVRAGMQNLKAQMNGMTPADQRIINAILGNADANNAANIQVIANAISTSNMSETGKRMALAGAVRDASSSRATISQGIANTLINRADTANNNAITQGQAVRTFEDVTLPTSKLSNEVTKRALSSAADTDIYNRISTLFASGSVSTAQNDQTLQNLVKNRLGPNATPEEIAAEIKTQWAAFNETKKSDFNNNAEQLIGAAVDNEQDIATILSDDSIRRTVAGANGLDVNDEADRAKIDEKINTLYKQIDLTDAEVTYKNLVKSGYVDKYIADTPDFKQDMLSAIGDLQMKGLIDPVTGAPLTDAVIDWPWNDPDTYFKYNDWDGNGIDVGTPVASNAISLVGNGVDYKNTNGQAVTNADATAAWDKLSSSEKHKYFGDGATPDIKKFLEDKFPAVVTSAGEKVPLMTADQYGDKITGSESYANQMGDLTSSFVSLATVPDKLTSEKGGSFPSGNIPTGSFIYYDDRGNPQITTKDEGNLGYIWQQLSTAYGKPPGTMLNAVQFKDVWKEGKPWRVDADGKISNLAAGGKDPKFENAVSVADAIVHKKSYSSSPDLVDEAKTLVAQWDKVPANLKADGNFFLESVPTTYRETAGMDRWALTQQIIDHVDKNKGKLYQAKNGRLYTIGGYENVGGEAGNGNRNATGKIFLYDFTTGEKVYYSSDSGGGEERLLNGASYA